MSDGIGLTAAVRSNLMALQKLTSELGRAQTRLATGKRVNNPSDNPAAFFTASALNARAAALNTVIDGIGTGKRTLETANAGIESMQALISQARALAYEALNSTSTLAQVDGSVTGLTGATAITMDNNDTITVNDGTTTATYTHQAGQDVQDFVDAINNTPNLKVEVSLTSDGRIRLESTGVNNITIGGSASGGELSAIGLTAGTTTSTTNATRQSLALEFNALRTQIDAIAADSGYNGQNLLGGSTLTVAFNEDGSAKVTVAGSLTTASSLGLDAANGSFQSDTDINAALGDLDAASVELKGMASSYGTSLSVVAIREDFAKSMSNLLSTGADDLVLADTNYEAAVLLALTARQDLAATSLSLASKADQTVLRLFGVG